MKRSRARTSKTRRFVEAFLLLAGVIAIGIWGWSYVRRAVFQSWGNRVLDHRIHGPSATVSRPPAAPHAPAPPIRNGALIGRLAIPRLNVRSVVREGAGEDTLDVALGHIPGTALPGQPGNVGVAGHRDTLFRGLRHIAKNDVIEFQTPAGSYSYKVESTGIVKPTDVGVLGTGRHPEMTLVTCYPFYYVGSAPERFIVKARLVTEPTTAPAIAASPTLPAVAAVQPASHSAGRKVLPSIQPAPPAAEKVAFHLSESQSRELVPGIRLGLSSADAAAHRASVWMLVTPEQHTISLKNQAEFRPVFFHGHDDGKQRELMITQVTANSVTGYLLLYGSARSNARSSQSPSHAYPSDEKPPLGQ
jgi:sortase A